MRADNARNRVLKSGPFDGGRAALALLAAIAAGAAFLAILMLSACSGSLAASIRADGGASLSLQAEVPPALAARLRSLAGGGKKEAAPSPLFDLRAIRESVAKRPYLALTSLSAPTPESLRAELAVARIADLSKAEETAKSGLVGLTSGPGWTELRIRLERKGAASAMALFPGIDPHLIEALSPPALEEEPLTAEEYRLNLKTILASAMPAMEAAAMTVSLAAPGPVLSSGGGTLSGRVLTARIPIVDALTLEKPIEFWLRWEGGK